MYRCIDPESAGVPHQSGRLHGYTRTRGISRNLSRIWKDFYHFWSLLLDFLGDFCRVMSIMAVPSTFISWADKIVSLVFERLQNIAITITDEEGNTRTLSTLSSLLNPFWFFTQCFLIVLLLPIESKYLG
jgi:hypothetical protein